MPKIRKNKKKSTAPKTVERGTAQAFSRSRKNSPAGEASAKLKKELGYGAKTRDKARGTEHRGAGKAGEKMREFAKLMKLPEAMKKQMVKSPAQKTTVTKSVTKSTPVAKPTPKPAPKPTPKAAAKKKPKPVEKKGRKGRR